MLINRVTLLGHKDHGKSTLIGNLLIKTGSVSEQRLNEAKRTSKNLGRKFEPGYILDSFYEEREQEMTIDTTRAQIKYKGKAFEFIDVPGHEELIKNMISGASYAKFAVLLVSAKPGEGIRDQTKRHLFIAKMLGIKKILIAINKMDTVSYDKEVFHQIKGELEGFLEKIGFNHTSTTFIPVSAYDGENLTARTKKISWYKGPSLAEAMLESVKEPTQDKNERLRMVVQGHIGEGRDRMLTGKIVTGSIKNGDTIRVMPSGAETKVKQIFVKGTRGNSAKKGENVALLTDKNLKTDRGDVIYHSGDHEKSSSKIKSLLFMTRQMGKGMSIRFNGLEIPCRQLKIESYIDTSTGNTSKKLDDVALNAANVDISLSKEINAEPFDVSQDLGRFVLYEGKEFAGIGIIKSVAS